MAQVSGSISLDMDKVIRETARLVMTDMVREFRPAESEDQTTILEEVKLAVAQTLAGVIERLDKLEGLLSDQAAGPRPISTVDAVQAVQAHLPAGTGTSQDPNMTHGQVARFLINNLEASGYAVMKSSIELSAGPQDISGDPYAVPSNRIAPKGVDVEAASTSARADARLAEANSNGPTDSWWEED